MRDNTKAQRFEMDVSGHLAIADYELKGDKLHITHVEVPEELRGQGVAAKLMAEIVEEANRKTLIIVPICSYAASYLQRHPQ